MHSLPLAPATSALASTLALLLQCTGCSRLQPQAIAHVDQSEAATSLSPLALAREDASPMRRPALACLSPGGGSSARRIALARLQPRSRLLLGAIALTIACIGTSLRTYPHGIRVQPERGALNISLSCSHASSYASKYPTMDAHGAHRTIGAHFQYLFWWH